MKIAKKLIKYILFICLLPIAYLLVALVLSYIPVGQFNHPEKPLKTIYLTTNGVHLDIVIPKQHIDKQLLKGLRYNMQDRYLAFGWGDRDFYLNTPTWDDLTAKTALSAFFLKSATLIHLTRYAYRRQDWVAVKITDKQLHKINDYIYHSFELGVDNQINILEGRGYSKRDDFYEAKGSYSCFKTCNTWVNTALIESNIRACLWTPFDFVLLDLHRGEN